MLQCGQSPSIVESIIEDIIVDFTKCILNIDTIHLYILRHKCLHDLLMLTCSLRAIATTSWSGGLYL